jgi:hypothetical protein
MISETAHKTLGVDAALSASLPPRRVEPILGCIVRAIDFRRARLQWNCRAAVGKDDCRQSSQSAGKKSMVEVNRAGFAVPTIASRFTPPTGCLAAPPLSRCSSEIMPKKTSRPKASPKSANTDTDSARHTSSVFSFLQGCNDYLNSLNNRPVSDVEGLQEVKHIGERFVEFARIPASQQNQFLVEITSAFREWCFGQIYHGDYYHEYVKMRREANALLKRLSAMTDMLQQPIPNAGINLEDRCAAVMIIRRRKGHNAFQKGNVSFLVDLRERISILIEGLDDAIQCLGGPAQARPMKNLSPINGHPRLTSLVFALGCAALRASGTFTAHRKDGPKGRLVRALDELRTCLSRTAPALAELLPDGSRHPVTKYERILKEARRSVFSPSDYFASERFFWPEESSSERR